MDSIKQALICASVDSRKQRRTRLKRKLKSQTEEEYYCLFGMQYDNLPTLFKKDSESVPSGGAKIVLLSVITETDIQSETHN